jgi:hypothetical protein
MSLSWDKQPAAPKFLRGWQTALPPQPVAAALLFLIGLAATGWLLYLVAPSAPAVTPDIASRFLMSEGLKPEPGEHFIYFGLLLATPFLLLASAMIALRFPDEAPDVRDAVLVTGLVVGCLTIVITDRAVFMLLAAEVIGRLRILATAPFVAVLLLATARYLRARPIVEYRISFWSACALSIIFPLSTLVFGAAALNDGYDFIQHWDAVFYSVVKINGGGTCLADVVPQYGCYGEFLHPIFRLAGLSVSKASFVFAALQAVSSLCVTVFCFRNMRPAAALAASWWSLILPNTITLLYGYHYFQYLPVRMLFPSMSLLLLAAWQRYGGARLAMSLGVFSGVGIFWNLDSGGVVTIALAALILFGGYPESRPLISRFRHFGFYCAGAGIAMVLIYFYLQFKSGFEVDLANFTYFQRIFFVSGFAMLPMPRPPSLWTIVIAIYAITLAGFAANYLKGTTDRRSEGAAFLALLGTGLFSYFVGRSHPFVAALCGWPSIVLLFLLLERASPIRGDKRLQAGIVVGAVPWIAVMAALLLFMARAKDMVSYSAKGWSTALQSTSVSLLRSDANFIRDHSAAHEPVAVLATHQASLLAEAQRPSANPGPGFTETLLWADAERTIAFLLKSGPRDVFIGANLLSGTKQTVGFVPWVKLNFDRLRTVYDVAEIGPNGRLIHLTRHVHVP